MRTFLISEIFAIILILLGLSSGITRGPLQGALIADTTRLAMLDKANTFTLGQTINAASTLKGKNVIDSLSNVRIAYGGVVQGDSLQLSNAIYKGTSTVVRNSHDAEASNVTTSYVKVKTIVLTNGLIGRVRFYFDIKYNGVSGPVYGRIYRNGVALGTEISSTSSTYETRSDDITQAWKPGDLCQLYAKGAASAQVDVRNFRIAYADSTAPVASANTTP